MIAQRFNRQLSATNGSSVPDVGLLFLAICDRVNRFEDGLFWLVANEVTNLLSVFNERKEWNVSDVELRSQLRLLFNIHLTDLNFSLPLGCDFFQCWCQSHTGATPVGPKVNEDRDAAFENFCLKVFLCDVQNEFRHGHTPQRRGQ